MIIGVAIVHKELMICLPKPNRHHDCIRYAVGTLGLKPPCSGIQGFYTTDGLFLDRNEAKKYAKEHGQLITDRLLDTLFSEDLW